MHILKRYSAFEELHDTLRRTLPVRIFSLSLHVLSDIYPYRSILSFHLSLLYLQRQLLHAFVQLSWIAVESYSNFGWQVFYCTPSWVDEMLCGLGY